jgi:hypothetical protein
VQPETLTHFVFIPVLGSTRLFQGETESWICRLLVDSPPNISQFDVMTAPTITLIDSLWDNEHLSCNGIVLNGSAEWHSPQSRSRTRSAEMIGYSEQGVLKRPTHLPIRERIAPFHMNGSSDSRVD